MLFFVRECMRVLKGILSSSTMVLQIPPLLLYLPPLAHCNNNTGAADSVIGEAKVYVTIK